MGWERPWGEQLATPGLDEWIAAGGNSGHGNYRTAAPPPREPIKNTISIEWAKTMVAKFLEVSPSEVELSVEKDPNGDEHLMIKPCDGLRKKYGDAIVENAQFQVQRLEPGDVGIKITL